MIRSLTGDCRDILPTLADRSVHCIVTSPPYYGLRSYLPNGHDDKHREIGLDASPEAYVATLVAVFREARRILRDDGTLWLVLGDNYGPGKQLQGIPWKVALALQANGWILRSSIIWAKPNPMPESVTDRPTSAHEHVFLLSKRPTYYFDSVAIAERTVDAEAVTEYAAAHETLYDLPNGKGRKPLRKGQIGQRRAEPGLPFLQYEADGRVPSDARRTGEIESIQSSEQRQTEPPSGDARIQPISKSEGCEGSLESDGGRASLYGEASSNGQAEGGSTAILRQREGARDHRSLSCDSEGQGVFGSGSSQAPRSYDDRQYVHGARVGDAEGTSRAPLPLLPASEAAVDDGSCDPALKRRASHGVEHRPGVPDLQQPQGQPGALSSLRNVRNVWTVATQPYAAAHFATFPPALVEPCIKAGTSEKGCCSACGKAWVRVVEETRSWRDDAETKPQSYREGSGNIRVRSSNGGMSQSEYRLAGWSRSCACSAAEPVPCVVLDPFGGAGTVGLVADRLGRDAVLIDLNPHYSALAFDRLVDDAPLFVTVSRS